MANPWARDRATIFYLGFGLFGLAAILIGFSTTYILPMARRTIDVPWVVHMHGAAATSWILLLIYQTVLVRGQRTPSHRRVGRAGLPLAVAAWGSGIATAAWAARRDFPGSGTAASSSLAGTVTGLSLFLLLIVMAILLRRRPDWHKRLIMLGTVQLLWPAIFRWRHVLPPIPHPDVWLAIVVAYTPIVVAAARDWRVYGRVHPVWMYVAPALVAEQSIEFVYFDQGITRAFGQWLFALLA